MNNYELSRDRAQTYFLRFDQQKIADTWNLSIDADFLYVTFFDRDYQICRKTGSVLRISDKTPAGFEEVLSIFDLLCHEGDCKFLSGRFAPVNSLKHRPRAIGVDNGFYSKIAAEFDRAPERFREACLRLGGKSVSMGDIGFQFTVFRELSVILKFYHADEDFPASVTLLWDDNTLLYLYYETVFYIAGYLLHRILKEMNG